jgi:hypothetical protein
MVRARDRSSWNGITQLRQFAQLSAAMARTLHAMRGCAQYAQKNTISKNETITKSELLLGALADGRLAAN